MWCHTAPMVFWMHSSLLHELNGILLHVLLLLQSGDAELAAKEAAARKLGKRRVIGSNEIICKWGGLDTHAGMCQWGKFRQQAAKGAGSVFWCERAMCCAFVADTTESEADRQMNALEEAEFDRRLGVDRGSSSGGGSSGGGLFGLGGRGRQQQQQPERGRAAGGRRFDDVFDRRSDAERQGARRRGRDDWDSW